MCPSPSRAVQLLGEMKSLLARSEIQIVRRSRVSQTFLSASFWYEVSESKIHKNFNSGRGKGVVFMNGFTRRDLCFSTYFIKKLRELITIVDRARPDGGKTRFPSQHTAMASEEAVERKREKRVHSHGSVIGLKRHDVIRCGLKRSQTDKSLLPKGLMRSRKLFSFSSPKKAPSRSTIKKALVRPFNPLSEEAGELF